MKNFFFSKFLYLALRFQEGSRHDLHIFHDKCPWSLYCRWFASTYYLSGRVPSSCFFPGPTEQPLCLSLLGYLIQQVSISVSETASRTLPREPSRLLKSSLLFPCMGPSRVGASLDPLTRHSVEAGCFCLSVLRDMKSHD